MILDRPPRQTGKPSKASRRPGSLGLQAVVSGFCAESELHLQSCDGRKKRPTTSVGGSFSNAYWLVGGVKGGEAGPTRNWAQNPNLQLPRFTKKRQIVDLVW